MLGNDDVSETDLTTFYAYVGDDCPPALRCPICKDPFVDPVELTACRHTFCARCLQRYRHSAQKPSSCSPSKQDNSAKTIVCPVCKCESDETSVTAPYDAHPIVKSQLDELMVKCIECQLQMQRQFFPMHFEKQCEYRIVKCKNANCAHQVVRKELADHLANCTRIEGVSEAQGSSTPRTTSRMLTPVGARWNTPAALAAVAASEGNDTPSFFSGVVFEYYQGEFDCLPDFDKLESSYAGVVGGFSVNEGTELAVFDKAGDNERSLLDTGNFAVRFTAYLKITQEGLFTFYVSSNDGSALYIDGERIIDNDGQHYNTTAEGQVQLAKGRVQLQVHFFHKNGKIMEGIRSGASLTIQYSCRNPRWLLSLNSIPKQAIPESALEYNIQDPRIRRELMKALEKRQAKKTELNDDAGQRANAEACANPRELQLQLEIAQATIRSLQNSVYNLTLAGDLKLQAMRRALEEERSKAARMAAEMRDVINFGEPRKQVKSFPGKLRYGELGLPVKNECEEEQSEVSCPDDEVERLMNRNIDDVRKLKQLYFCALALGIKMNSQHHRPRFSASSGDGIPSIQELYELCDSDHGVPIEGWPMFLNRHLQLSSCLASGRAT